MSEFYVGQKVVCMDDEPFPRGLLDGEIWQIKRGNVYTIKEFGQSFRGNAGVKLREAVLVMRFFGEGFYLLSRFRPIESQAIQLFRRIAADASKHRKITVREDV